MNIEAVKSIFTLFSGEEDCRKYMPVLSLALTETERMLVSEEAGQDIRVDFLCAAIANYRFCQLNAARDRTESTYAGKMLTASSGGKTLEYAAKLLSEYIDMCSDIIKPRTFMFMSFGDFEMRDMKDA